MNKKLPASDPFDEKPTAVTLQKMYQATGLKSAVDSADWGLPVVPGRM